MQGLYKAFAAAGLNQKAFAAETDIDKVVLNKAAKGILNLTPEDFKKVCARSGLSPDQIATVQDVDYGVIPTSSIAESRKAAKRKKSKPVSFRVTPKQRKQLDKDLKVLNFPTVQSWGDFCLKQLHVEAERQRCDE